MKDLRLASYKLGALALAVIHFVGGYKRSSKSLNEVNHITRPFHRKTSKNRGGISRDVQEHPSLSEANLARKPKNFRHWFALQGGRKSKPKNVSEIRPTVNQSLPLVSGCIRFLRYTDFIPSKELSVY